MGWSLGYDNRWGRDVGYGVSAFCDHPKCNEKIDRGISYVCGSEALGGEYGCGLYFCSKHLTGYRKPHGSDRNVELCNRCERYKAPYRPKPEHPEWAEWKLTDESWKEWRKENPEEVKKLKTLI